MKIVMFSITPLFPQHDMGGGQKHLRTIAHYLAGRGHDITILCTRRADTRTPFRWGERIEVLPILRFKQPFPSPYDTPAFNIANIVQDVAEQLEGANRFYIHDGEFLFPFVYKHVPTIVSLRDNVYPETTLGAFYFQGHRLIVISEYARQFFTATAGRFFPELPGRMRVIHNGIDWERFKPTPPGRILDLVPVDPERDLIVLHPHRPEESKGLRQTIAVVDRLVHTHRLTNVKVCVPLWLGLEQDPAIRATYDHARADIAARGLTSHFVFHPWVPVDLLPEYYSLGGVTLALGSFVESFGNAVYESLGCGTPSIVARISSHRELLPENLIDKVDYDDNEAAAALAAAILTDKRRTSQATLDYLHTHYRIDRQLEAYAEAIENAAVLEDLRFEYTPAGPHTHYWLAPWCYVAKRGIYHDYRADYLEAPALQSLIAAHPDGFTPVQAAAHGIDAAQIEDWRRDGYLVPVNPAQPLPPADGEDDYAGP
jgi:glycosyltransferase involved in cell wall biosynthesis